jgi:hypothetical protein
MHNALWNYVEVMGGQVYTLWEHGLISTQVVQMRLSTGQDPDKAANLQNGLHSASERLSAHSCSVCTLSKQKEMLHKPPTKHPLHPLHATENPLKGTSNFSSTVFNTNWTHSPSQTWSNNPHFCHPTYLTGNRTGSCTLTLNMVINQLYHFLKINLNVILSLPVWSSMKFPTRIQITCSSLYAIHSSHHNLTALLQ